ncbi:hypothetical protein AB6A40_008147 [Gnathostoma spinigerum]|uniref:Uncharacterized protein n=1 Tax=Gnathostoma spinigerum TaxID=75299 RepID=A0ABD6ENJ2_9BILA
MLLLAERYKMKVLKMMCSGIIADHMIACSEENKEMNEFSSEMHVLAMRTSSGGSPHGDHMDESLAENVVDQVKQLSQRIRRVSLSRT